ncbi:MAG: BtpA/SgcQ family protein [Thermomicrobiales bacterium]
MRTFENLGAKKVVLGMVHLGALPGTPFFGDGDFAAVRARAVSDAQALEAGGADGCVVQNAGDRVFAIDDADPVIVVAMTDIVRAIRAATGPAFQIGVQILRNDLKGALAIAHVCGGSFLRCGALVGTTVTASGIMQGDPFDFQAYRSRIGAQGVNLIAEIHSMHFEWLGGRPVGEVARAARSAGADAVGLCDPDDEMTLRLIQEVKAAASGMPIIIGGYTNHDNVARLLADADGAIVGGAFEKGGRFGAVQVDAVREYVDIVSRL